MVFINALHLPAVSRDYIMASCGVCYTPLLCDVVIVCEQHKAFSPLSSECSRKLEKSISMCQTNDDDVWDDNREISKINSYDFIINVDGMK